MEVTSKDLGHVELITIKGRMDSVEAAQLVQALKSAYDRGKYKIIVDLSELEYMSSAGFRALGDAQRNNKRSQRGEVMLVQVPDRIREALELVGFTEYFNLFTDVTTAVQYAENLSAGVSAAGAQPSAPEK